MILKRENAPIRNQALRHIREAIITGQFEPGEHLSERKLCDFIGASRTIVREVLRHLESEGLVKSIPQKGPIVATITEEEANQIYEVREVLEGFMCVLFAERSTPNDKNRLRLSLEKLEEYVQKGDFKNQLKESNKFYEILMEGCGNEVLHHLLKSLHARISFLRRMSLSCQGRPSRSARELRGIYEAIEKGDIDAIYNSTKYHVREAKLSMLQFLRANKQSDQSSLDR